MQDLFIDNILCSYRNGPFTILDRQLALDHRYYLIDFEFSVYFPDPCSSKTVVGPPVPFERYYRDYPAELQSETPHCPFKLDIWQIGHSFLESFPVNLPLDENLVELTIL